MHIAVADMADGRDTVNLVEAAGRDALAVVCDVSSPNSVAAMAKTGAAKIRPRRYRGELRRNLPAARLRRHDLRRLAQGFVHQSRRHIPRDRGLRAGHARPQMGPHRQFGLEHIRLGHHRIRALRRLKGGIIGFTRGLAGDVAADGITVNAIAPGLTRSPGTLVRKPRPGLPTMDENSPPSPACRRSSASRCRRIWSARCRFSPATTRRS